MGPPKALDWPNPISSISTMRTLGALAGALTSNRGGGVALRASNTVLCGYWGSGIGSTVRSVGSTTGTWAATGIARRRHARLVASSRVWDARDLIGLFVKMSFLFA